MVGMEQTKATAVIERARLAELLAALESNALVQEHRRQSPCNHASGHIELSDFGKLKCYASSFAWDVRLNTETIHPFFIGDRAADYVETFLFAIAPFVLPGGYIEMRGEDHELWRWVFSRGKVVQITPRVTIEWPEERLDAGAVPR